MELSLSSEKGGIYMGTSGELICSGGAPLFALHRGPPTSVFAFFSPILSFLGIPRSGSCRVFWGYVPGVFS